RRHPDGEGDEEELGAALDEDQGQDEAQPQEGPAGIGEDRAEDPEEEGGSQAQLHPPPGLVPAEEQEERQDHVDGQADLRVSRDEAVRRAEDLVTPPRTESPDAALQSIESNR